MTYPFSPKDTAVWDDYFGTRVRDPYRWLENDTSDATREWLTKQNLVTFGYLGQIPFRESLKNRLKKIWNYEKYGTPFFEGGKYYFFKNEGLQQQGVLYVQDTLDTVPREVLDPNKLSADGILSVGVSAVSPAGDYLAYAVSGKGSDWQTVYTRDLKTGRELADVLLWVKFTELAWVGNGFYYSRYPAPASGAALSAANAHCAVYFHETGTTQDRDRLVHSDPEHPGRFFRVRVTSDRRFLVLEGRETTSGNSLAVCDLLRGQRDFSSLVAGFDSDFRVVDHLDGRLLVLTNRSAARQQLVWIDPERPDESRWQVLIAEHPTDVLQSAVVCGDKIVCVYLHRAASVLRVFDFQGKKLREPELPELGSVNFVSGKKGHGVAFFDFSSFLRPVTIYQMDMETLETRVFKAPVVDFNPEGFVTEQVWYKSRDGVQVPMFVTRRKNMAFDGRNPTLLYGYGGFNQSLTPSFSPTRAALLEQNGIYAVANIRGGGEFGEAWHLAGTKCRKQNTFDDFIAAAEYLVEKKYTSPKRLAIQGGSNGGLLVGACMTQRPELFGVCLPAVGVMDMLRYHRFTIGYAWSTDYGRSDDSKSAFSCLYAYSPLHRLRKQAYPATMVTTADHDDRVVPAHSFKFAATLQECQQGETPVLLRIETSAGHGAGKPTGKLIDEAADWLSFMLYQMEVQVGM